MKLRPGRQPLDVPRVRRKKTCGTKTKPKKDQNGVNVLGVSLNMGTSKWMVYIVLEHRIKM